MFEILFTEHVLLTELGALEIMTFVTITVIPITLVVITGSKMRERREHVPSLL